MDVFMELVGTVRTLRSEYNVPAGREVEVRVSRLPEPLRAALESERLSLGRLAKIGQVVEVEPGEASRDGAGASAVLRSGAELFLPLAGLIDVERERDRLGRELDRMRNLLRGVESKLSNEKFTSRAPEEVVAREHEKAAAYREQADRLAEKLAALVG